ncbi:MAG: hypothetical protein RMM58_11720 [Chloroflexota bacterium]|nr:hypothetical protein [Dehalococcoidia bacterium]MDW8254533.1 hypothetical protein [Chloroflexota bacterium]
MIDQVAGVPRFYQRAGDGRSQRIEPAEGVYGSAALPGFRLPVEWARRVPTVEEGLRTLGLLG